MNDFKQRLDELVKNLSDADLYVTQMMIDKGAAPLTADQSRYLRLHHTASKLHAEVERWRASHAQKDGGFNPDYCAANDSLREHLTLRRKDRDYIEQLRTAADEMENAGEQLRIQLCSGVPSTENYFRSINNAVEVWEKALTAYEQARGE